MTHIRAKNCSFKTFMAIALRNIREERKLTQEQLASTLNCDRTYISALERGKKNINLRFLDRFVSSLYPDNCKFVANIMEEFDTECRRRREDGSCDRGDKKDFWCPQGTNAQNTET